MATSLLSANVPPLVGSEMLECGEQKRSESPLVAIHGAQVTLFQKPREESLGQVFRVMLRETASSDERVERIPVRAAEFFQRGISDLRRLFACREHNAPVRGGKDRRS